VLSVLVQDDLFAILMVFARVGGAMMVLPGFGEVFISARIRLLMAMVISIVILPVVAGGLPPVPGGPLEMFMHLGREIVVGVFIGGVARALLAALHVAGTIIGFQTSLANAQMFDPLGSGNSALTASFFNLLGVFLIFASDLHHLMLGALVDSYTLFVPGAALPMEDFAQTAVRIFSHSFLLAMQIAAPFLVMGMLFYIGLGLLARLMPQVQVFFIAIPIQLFLGFMIMAGTLSVALLWFAGRWQDSFQSLFVAGG